MASEVLRVMPVPRAEAAPDGSSPAPEARRRIVHSSDLWLLLLVAVVLGLFLLNLVRPLAELIYSPTALLIVVIMVVEFLVLKARDRSRFYRLELQLMRNRRREDIRLLRETRDAVARAVQLLDQARERLDAQGALDEPTRALLGRLAEDLRQTHDDIQRR